MGPRALTVVAALVFAMLCFFVLWLTGVNTLGAGIGAVLASAAIAAYATYSLERSELPSSFRQLLEFSAFTAIAAGVFFVGDCVVGAVLRPELPFLRACTNHTGFVLTLGVCGLMVAILCFAAIRLGLASVGGDEG